MILENDDTIANVDAPSMFMRGHSIYSKAEPISIVFYIKLNEFTVLKASVVQD